MTNDPIRQADIERRLANLAKAPRCGARTRRGRPCRQAAVSGRTRCRMHGGAKGSGGPPGSRNGNFKHGFWTTESKRERRVARAKSAKFSASCGNCGVGGHKGKRDGAVGCAPRLELTNSPFLKCFERINHALVMGQDRDGGEPLMRASRQHLPVHPEGLRRQRMPVRRSPRLH